MNPDRIKVLCLVGKGRSGGTLLNNLLGQIHGFVAPGELRHLWGWGLQQGSLCGCGEPLPRCAFWQEVLKTAFDGRTDPDASTIVAWERQILSWRAIPRMIVQSPHGRPRWRALASYADAMSRIYRALAKTTGANVVVESTKWAASPTALGLVPATDSYVLHLVRDPRAVIYSWKRRDKRWVDRPGSPAMDRFGPFFSVASWWGRNSMAHMTGFRRGDHRYVRYRYEDFTSDPQASLRRICAWLGEPDPDLSFMSDRKATIAPTHTVAGNPNRFRTGEIEVRLDDEWLGRQPLADRLVGTVFSMPLLQFYGYPLVPQKGR